MPDFGEAVNNDIESCELLARWALAELERSVRARPELASEVRKALQRTAEQYLPDFRAALSDLVVNSTDPKVSARAATLLSDLKEQQNGGRDA